MTDLNTATFRATIPPILSGIKTGGDGMRLQLDIPENEMGEAAKLIAMRGMILTVTVQVAGVEQEPQENENGHRTIKRRAAKQRNR